MVAATMAAVPTGRPARAPSAVPGGGADASVDELGGGAPPGLDAVGVTPGEAFATTRRHLERPQGRRPARRHALHLPAPRAVDRPGPTALPDARRPGRRRPQLHSVGGPGGGDPPATGRRRWPGAAGRSPSAGRVARYAWEDHYGALRPRSTAVAERLKADGWRGPRPRRRQRPGRPRGRLPGRPRLVRQERQPAAPGRGQLVRARLGRHRRPARAAARRRRWPTAAARAPAASTAARPAPSSPRRGRRPPLPGLAAAGDGAVPRRAPGGAGRPDLRLRRLPGGLPAQPPRDAPARHPAPAEPRPTRPGSTCSTCWRPPTTSCSTATAAGTCPDRQPRYLRRNALVVLGNVGDAADPAVVAALRGRPGRRRPAGARPRRVGRPPARARRPAAARPLAGDADPLVRAELAAARAARARVP